MAKPISVIGIASGAAPLPAAGLKAVAPPPDFPGAEPPAPTNKAGLPGPPSVAGEPFGASRRTIRFGA